MKNILSPSVQNYSIELSIQTATATKKKFWLTHFYSNVHMHLSKKIHLNDMRQGPCTTYTYSKVTTEWWMKPYPLRIKYVDNDGG